MMAASGPFPVRPHLPTLQPVIRLSFPNPLDLAVYTPFLKQSSPNASSRPSPHNSGFLFSLLNDNLPHSPPSDYHDDDVDDSYDSSPISPNDEFGGNRHFNGGDMSISIPNPMKKESPGSYRLYYCEYCGKEFRQQYNLTRHIRSHTGYRPYKCNMDGCTKSFSTASVLRTHQRVHTGERPYTCTYPYCGKSFSQKGHLSRHCKTHER
eukprot:GILI01002194.1.p1 GENE.GILI01002194.1~~GILI01002194.1.p1  ORF type:complete len:208 (+),score=26.58 GILI01002194.1:133-756(+)